VTYPTGQFPNETYLNGLRDNPGPTLAVVYDEFRMPIIQAITANGGSEETAAAVFQLAVNDAAQMGRLGTLPDTVPFYQFLQALSLAHFNADPARQDIATEAPAMESETEAPAELGFELPGQEDLIRSRQKVYAWERFQALEPPCRNVLYELLGSEETADKNTDEADETSATCTEAYIQLLSKDSETYSAIPYWASVALRDRDGFAVWKRSQELEAEWKAGPPAPPESNRIWRWAVGILLLVAVGYGLYQFYFRPMTAAEVFADNFVPPTSMLGDMEARYGAEMGNDSSGAQPNQCMLLLQEADAYYQANEYEAAMDPLLLIVLDSNSICQSDAWFYLGIVQLKREDPSTAIQCFAKIEDLGRYGEDLYWYQALAFVQLAKENPMLRDKARGAIERTLGNTRDPKRRKQAEKMLKNLSQ
jgi:hypothetical protein